MGVVSAGCVVVPGWQQGGPAGVPWQQGHPAGVPWQQGHLAVPAPPPGAVPPVDGRRPPAPTPPESPETAIDRLCRQLREVCASAVDPLEIAAALEAEAGLTGTVLRARYGCADVFALADEMYRRTARWPAEPAPGPDPWASDGRAHVGHAVLYGLPSASYAVAAPLLSGPGALTAVLVSMVTSWTLSQALAHLGHARLSRLDRPGAVRVLRLGLPAGAAVLGVALAVAAALVPVDGPALLFSAGQGGYLLAATVLLVLGAERWVFVALVPGAGAALAFALAGRPPWVPLWLPLVASAAVATVVAVVRTRGPRVRVVPDRAERRGARAQAAFGLAAAGLLAFPVAVSGFGAGLAVPAVAVLTLPLSLSMGAAEWSLYRYRRAVQALLERCRTPREFGPGARRVLLGAVLRYVAVAAVLIAATAVLPGPGGITPVAALSYLALGAALFVALLMQALGVGAGTGPACGAALGLEAALVLGPPALDVVTAQLVAAALLSAVLLAVAAAVLGRVAAHT